MGSFAVNSVSSQPLVFRATSRTKVRESDSFAALLKNQLFNTLTALPVNITITATPRDAAFFFLLRETFSPEPLSIELVVKSFLQSANVQTKPSVISVSNFSPSFWITKTAPIIWLFTSVWDRNR